MAYPVNSTVGIRFLGNNDPGHMEVHDLTKKTNNCQVDEILRAKHAVGFRPDTLEQAHKEEYDNCAWCIGGSTR